MAVTVTALSLMSIGIEAIQHIFSLGVAQTDDVIHNTFGALLGAWRAGIRLP